MKGEDGAVEAEGVIGVGWMVVVVVTVAPVVRNVDLVRLGVSVLCG